MINTMKLLLIKTDILSGKVASASADTRPCALTASTWKVSETDVSNSSLFMTPFHTRLSKYVITWIWYVITWICFLYQHMKEVE